MRNKILLLISLIIFNSFCVFSQAHEHKSNSFERFDSMRILPPSKILEFDGVNLRVYISTKELVVIKDFTIEDDSEITSVFKEEWKSHLWLIVYCIKDNHIYTISKLKGS